jgi:excisionase family DNA binding protein
MRNFANALVVRPTAACEALDCGIETLYKWINDGTLESYMDGPRSRKITMRSINALIERRLAESAGKKGWAPDNRFMKANAEAEAAAKAAPPLKR